MRGVSRTHRSSWSTLSSDETYEHGASGSVALTAALGRQSRWTRLTRPAVGALTSSACQFDMLPETVLFICLFHSFWGALWNGQHGQHFPGFLTLLLFSVTDGASPLGHCRLCDSPPLCCPLPDSRTSVQRGTWRESALRGKAQLRTFQGS